MGSSSGITAATLRQQKDLSLSLLAPVAQILTTGSSSSYLALKLEKLGNAGMWIEKK